MKLGGLPFYTGQPVLLRHTQRSTGDAGKYDSIVCHVTSISRGGYVRLDHGPMTVFGPTTDANMIWSGRLLESLPVRTREKAADDMWIETFYDLAEADYAAADKHQFVACPECGTTRIVVTPVGRSMVSLACTRCDYHLEIGRAIKEWKQAEMIAILFWNHGLRRMRNPALMVSKRYSFVIYAAASGKWWGAPGQKFVEQIEDAAHYSYETACKISLNATGGLHLVVRTDSLPKDLWDRLPHHERIVA